jgi:hypothetical protein
VIDPATLNAEQRDGLQRGIEFYRPTPASEMRSLPFRRRGFVEIPVSLPDDEIPLDRMYIHDADFLEKMWRGILAQTYERGELFTLQLHPERIDFFTGALRALLADARERRPHVWIATLDEIARWWVDKANNRVDFAREGDGCRVDVQACDGSTVLVHENGTERVVEFLPFVTAGARRPCVGVAPGSDRNAIAALTDLGYVVEVGVDPDAYAVHLGTVSDGTRGAIESCRAAIDRAPGPVVRFGVWPRAAQSALAVTGDIDALTIWDFVHRFRGQ